MGNSFSKYKRLGTDILIFIIGNVLAKAIQLFLMPMYTSYMSVAIYGTAELVNNMTELFFPIITLCLYEATFRFAIDEQFDNRIIINIVVRILMIMFIVGGALIFAINAIVDFEYMYYFLFVLYAMSLKNVFAYYVRGKGLSKVFALSGIINALILVGTSYIFLVVLSKNVRGYLLAIGLSYTGTALFLVLQGHIYEEIACKINILTKDIIKLLNYSLPLIFYNILYWVNMIAGRYILLFYTNSEAVGIYIAGIKIAAVINAFQQAVYSAFQFNVSYEFKDKKKELYYSDVCNILCCSYFGIGSIIICLIPLITKLTLKKAFTTAELYLPLIIFGAILNCISSIFGALYSAYKVTKRQIAVSVIGGILNVIICILLIPKVGIMGVCIANVVSNLAQLLYRMFDVKKFCNLNMKWNIFRFNILLLLIQVILMSSRLKLKTEVSVFLSIIILLINCFIYRKKLRGMWRGKQCQS